MSVGQTELGVCQVSVGQAELNVWPEKLQVRAVLGDQRRRRMESVLACERIRLSPLPFKGQGKTTNTSNYLLKQLNPNCHFICMMRNTQFASIFNNTKYTLYTYTTNYIQSCNTHKMRTVEEY